MRVAVIFVSILVTAAPSYASSSCMTETEARHHFGSVHLYWHGPDHCWDSTPGQHSPVHGIGRKEREQVQRKDREQVQRRDGRPRWRESMSEMLPDSERIQELKTRTSWNDRSYVADAAPADANWTNRWVDIVQTAPSVRVESGPTQEVASPVIVQNTEPMVRPYVVVVLFVCFGMVLMMACTAIIRPTR